MTALNWHSKVIHMDLIPYSPNVDVKETPKDVVVVADVPSVDPQKIICEVMNGNALRISGSVEEEKETKGKNFYRKERSTRSFQRVIPLPCSVKDDGAKAVTKNGTLTVTLPKLKEEPFKGKKIPIEEE